MDRKKLIFPLVALLLFGIGAWGMTQYLAKNRLLLQSENQYDRAFNSLLWHIDNAQVEITKALASNSPDHLMKLTANIWRETFQAKQNLAELPITFLSLNRTQRFLNQVNEFSFFLSQQATERKTLTPDEWSTLQKFHAQISEVNIELQKLSSQIVKREFQWSELARRAAQDIDGVPSNIMTTGFLNIDSQLQRKPEITYDGSILNYQPKPKVIKGKKISKQEAIKRAKEQLPELRARNIKVTSENRGNIPSYTLEAPPLVSGNPTYVDITKQEGKVLWFFSDRKVTQKRKTLQEAKTIAKNFVTEKMNFKNMTVVFGEVNRNMATISLAYNKDGVLRYTDMVRVKVALDNGQILGFDSRNYYTYHCKDALPKPKLSEADARRKVNSNLKINRVRLVVLLSDSFEEVLAYEVFAKLGKENIYVYVNALTGAEERIERRIIAPSEELVL